MLVLVSSCAKVRGGNGANPCRVQETSKQFIQQCSVAPAPVLTQGVALKPKASIESLPGDLRLAPEPARYTEFSRPSRAKFVSLRGSGLLRPSFRSYLCGTDCPHVLYCPRRSSDRHHQFRIGQS